MVTVTTCRCSADYKYLHQTSCQDINQKCQPHGGVGRKTSICTKFYGNPSNISQDIFTKSQNCQPHGGIFMTGDSWWYSFAWTKVLDWPTNITISRAMLLVWLKKIMWAAFLNNKSQAEGSDSSWAINFTRTTRKKITAEFYIRRKLLEFLRV